MNGKHRAPHRFFRELTLFCGLTVLLAGCAMNPVTGKEQLMLVSTRDEITMGRETRDAVIDTYGIYEDRKLAGYVNGIGKNLAKISHRPELPWEFRVMDSPVVNAFASPGGYIFVTRGLLASVNDEAELAGVLGHEIGHITARHGAANLSQMLLTSIGVSLGAQLFGDDSEMAAALMEVGAGFLFLKFSRDDERQADGLAVEYASRVGYDGNRLASFFRTLSRLDTLEQEKEGQLPEWFSTHPNPENREAAVQEAAAAWQAKTGGRPLVTNRQALLNMVDGMVFGRDPRQGFREGYTYFMPALGLQFNVAPGWLIEEEGRSVTMTDPDGNVALVVDRTTLSLDDAVSAFLEEIKQPDGRIRDLRTNGMQSRQVVSTVYEGGSSITVMAQFFPQHGEVLRMVAIAQGYDFQNYQKDLTLPMTSLQPIHDPAKRNVEPRRIAVRKAQSATTMREMLRQHHVQEKLWQQVALLNGMDLDSPVAAGESVKIVQGAAWTGVLSPLPAQPRFVRRDSGRRYR